MSDTIEQQCLSKGVKLTEQRRIIAKVISESKAFDSEITFAIIRLCSVNFTPLDKHCCSIVSDIIDFNSNK